MSAFIDLTAVGRQSESVERVWDQSDCMLYALAVGAGSDPTEELELTTENTVGARLRVLPTMAAVLAPVPSDLLFSAGHFDRTALVHSGHRLTIHREIPPAGSLRAQTEIVGIYDKPSGALIETRSSVALADTGEPLFDVGSFAFIRGAGGFGGPRGPVGSVRVPPDRPPDHTISYVTRPDQALLYRLTGDRNPLHSDPEFAARAGFDRPILHGLCTYGVAGRALVRALCAGDPGRLRHIEARFAAPVTPGESLTTFVWLVADGVAVFATIAQDRQPVLSAGYCEYLT